MGEGATAVGNKEGESCGAGFTIVDPGRWDQWVWIGKQVLGVQRGTVVWQGASQEPNVLKEIISQGPVEECALGKIVVDSEKFDESGVLVVAPHPLDGEFRNNHCRNGENNSPPLREPYFCQHRLRHSTRL